MAGLHVQIVQKILRMLLQKRKIDKFKEIENYIKEAKGLYLNKQLGAVLEIPILNIDQRSGRCAEMHVDDYDVHCLSPSSLCFHLNHLLD